MNFILSEMTFLRYFIPLAIEGHKRGLKSTMHWMAGGKYNCPLTHYRNLESLSKEYNFELCRIDEPIEGEGPTFMIEGVGRAHSKTKQKVSLTCNIDYYALYDRYKDEVDHMIFPSKYFALQKIPFQGKISTFDSPKIKYLGSPKYDIKIDTLKVKKKFNLKDKDKHALIILPKMRDVGLVNFDAILAFLKKLNYKIITKNRGKENFNFKGGDINITDEYWYPHPTMDLIKTCDLVINFDSLSIKECVMLRTKVINFHIKPYPQRVPDLYLGDYCQNIEVKDYTAEDLVRRHSVLEKATDDSFQENIDRFMFQPNSSKRILDFLNCSG